MRRQPSETRCAARLVRPAMGVGLLLALLLTAACKPSPEEAARPMLEQMRRQFEHQQFDSCLATIRLLRQEHPRAVEARREALACYQETVLRQAQADLMNTDSVLQRVKAEYDRLKTDADNHLAQRTATAEELHRLNRKKKLLDSLQTRFETQVGRIRFVHQKQREGKKE